MDSVRVWLQSIGLHQYGDAFENDGWDDMDIILTMTEQDVKSVVQKPGHVRKILLSLTKLNNESQERAEHCDRGKTDKEVISKLDELSLSGGIEVLSRVGNDNPALKSYSTIAEDNQMVIPSKVTDDELGLQKEQALEKHDSALQHIIATHALPVCSVKQLQDQETTEVDQLLYERGTHLLNRHDFHGDHEMVGTDSESSEDESMSLVCLPEHGSDIGINNQAIVARQDKTMSRTTNTIVKGSKNITIARKVQFVSTENQNTASNFETQIHSCLKTYRERENLFVKTRAYKDAIDILEDRNWVVVIGNPGDGKSTIAHQLLLDHDKKGFDAVIVTSPHDWKTMVGGKGKQSNKQIVLIDDMFGVSNVLDTIVNEWLSLLEIMRNVVSDKKGSLKVVCTNRKSVFNQVDIKTVKFKEFGKLSIVDLTVPPFSLSFEERATILKIYFDHFHIFNFYIEDIASIDFNYGFPHCVEIFCTNSIIRNKQGVEFFNFPIRVILNEIHDYQINDKKKFCALLMVLLSMGNMVYLESLEEKSEPFCTCRELSGLSTNSTIYVLNDAFIGLQNVYLSKEADTYVFKHDSFRECMAMHFAKSFPRHAIQLLDLDFLINRTQLKESDQSQLQLTVTLSEMNFKTLAERLTNEILNGNGFKVFNHTSWHDIDFQKCWFQYLKHKSHTEGVLCSKLLQQSYLCGFFKTNLLVCLAYLKLENVLICMLSLDELYTCIDKPTLRLHASDALIISTHKQLSHTLLQKLIEAGADVNAKFSYAVSSSVLFFYSNILPITHSTALWNAVKTKNHEITKILLKNGAKVLHSNQSGEAVFHMAIMSNSTTLLKCLLQYLVKRGKYTTEIESRGLKLIQVRHFLEINYEAYFCDSKMIKQFCTADTIKVIKELCSEDLWRNNKHDGTDAMSIFPPTCPSKIKHTKLTKEIIENILERNTDLNAINQNGMNYLHVILVENRTLLRPESFQSLLQVIDCNKQDHFGNTPLFYALKYSAEIGSEYLDMLFEKSDVSLVGPSKRNCLHFLAHSHAHSNLGEYIKMLKQNGVNIDALDTDGNAPVVYSASFETMEIFYKSGARLDCENDYGADILMQTLRNNSRDIIGKVHFLLQNGANPNRIDSDDKTVLHYLIDSTYSFETKKVVLELFLKYGWDKLTSEDSLKAVIIQVFESKQYNEKFFSCLMSQTTTLLSHINVGIPLLNILSSSSKRANVKLKYLQMLQKYQKLEYGKELYESYLNWCGINLYLSDQMVSLLSISESDINDLICVTLMSTKADLEKCCLLKSLLSKIPIDLSKWSSLSQSTDIKIHILSSPSCFHLLIYHGVKIDLLCVSNISLKEILSKCSIQAFQGYALKGVDLKSILGIKNVSLLLNEFAGQGSLKSIDALLRYGKELDHTVTDDLGNTIIHNLMARNGNVSERLICMTCASVNDVNTKNMKDETPLLMACCQIPLDLCKIKCLLENGGNIYSNDNVTGTTPLHLLMSKIGQISDSDNREIKNFFLYLISTGIVMYKMDNFGKTPLMYLMENAYSSPLLNDAIICLFQKGDIFDEHDVDGKSLLHYIAQSALSDGKKTHLSCIIINKGATVTSLDSHGRCPIDMTLYSITPSVNLCKELSQGVPREKVAQCLLNNVKHVNNPSIAELLADQILQSDAFINWQDITGMTFVSLACRHNNNMLVEKFLSKGSDPNIPDVLGHSAILSLLFSETAIDICFWFCECFRRDLVEELNFHTRSKFPWFVPRRSAYEKLKKRFCKAYKPEPFDLHCKIIKKINNFLEILQLLLYHGANSNQVDMYGKSPLHYCAEAPLVDSLVCPFMDILISQGANVNMKDSLGRTPIMLCAAYERTKYRRMNILIKAEADLFCEDDNGRPVQDYTQQAAGKMWLAINLSTNKN